MNGPFLRLLAALAICGAAHLLPAQPLDLQPLLEMDDIQDVDVTDDGRHVALQIGRANPGYKEKNGNLDSREKFLSRIEVTDLESGESVDPAPADSDAWNPAWSPQGDRLAFQVGVDDAGRMWVWSRQSRRARKISDLVPRRLNAKPVWTADGRSIVVPVLPAGMTNDTIRRDIGRTGGDTDYPLDRSTPGATVALYRAGRSAATEVKRQDFPVNRSRLADLALIDVESGQSRRLVTGRRPVRYCLSPDGRTLAFLDVVGQDEGSGYRNLYDLHLVDVATGKARVVARDIAQIGIYMDVSWSPDGRWLAWTDSGPIGKGCVYFAEVPTGEIREVPLQGSNSRLLAPLWDPASESVYLLTSKGLCRVRREARASEICPAPPDRPWVEILLAGEGRAAFNARSQLLLRARSGTKDESFVALDPVTGETRTLLTGTVAIAARRTRVNATGTTLVYTRESAAEPRQAWASDTEFTRPRQITRLNPLLAATPMGRSRLVEWRGVEGEVMRGALLLPPGHREGTRCPLVVYLYGDMRLSDELNQFGLNDQILMPYENMQLLATRGIAVLRPDTVTRPGRPMQDICASILPAVDRLVDEGLADPDRLGIMGRSYGGYSVLAVLVQTNRFRAAIEVAGQASLFGVFREMDPGGTNWKISWAEEHQGKMNGSVWQARDRWVENSPFFYLDRVTTPLLIAHGTKDTAVAVEAGDELFLALRHLGKEVEFAKYLGETHVISVPANCVDYASRMIGWFERHFDVRSQPPAAASSTTTVR